MTTKKMNVRRVQVLAVGVNAVGCYRVLVYPTGTNFGFAARILRRRGRKPVYVTCAYPHRAAAFEAAQRWIDTQG